MSGKHSDRVLVVDDDLAMRALASEVLDGAGFEVLGAADGEEAVRVFITERPEAVLMDVMMPVMDGYEACRRIRALPGGLTLPVLMMTGLGDLAAVGAAFDAGASDFITKPIIYSLLPHRIRYLLRASQAFRAARDSAQRLQRALRIARLVEWELEPSSETIRWSEGAEEILNLALGDRCSISDFAAQVHPDDRVRIVSAFQQRCAHETEYRIAARDGRTLIVHQEAQMVTDPETGVPRMIGATQDVTDLREAERKASRLAYYDTLTGLPNRAFLDRFLVQAVSHARDQEDHLAVLALDLDLFKRVNDTLGHPAGDALLREVASRLRSCLRQEDRIILRGGWVELNRSGSTPNSLAARLGGDEFIVVLQRIRSAEDAGKVARRIASRLCAPYRLDTTEVCVSSSVGIAMYPQNGVTAEELLKHADAAMYHAKEQGRNNVQFFSAPIHDKAQRRLAVESALRSALAAATAMGEATGEAEAARAGEAAGVDKEGASGLQLYYQPKLGVPSGQVVGAEALLRWFSPTLGTVSPAEAIPIAEDTGLIHPLGEWVLRTACRQAAEWARTIGPLRVSVNISGRQFCEPGFVRVVRDALTESNIDPALLELEITEGVVMQDSGASTQVLGELKALGIQVALDDFGTGYSSLAYLTRFPIDTLKIDGSFVRSVGTGRSEAIITAIVALSKSLELGLVAEGVETAEQLRFLERHGAMEVQGYLCARPMPAADLPRWLAERTAAGEPSPAKWSPAPSTALM
ncbi:MAG: EAL domain-containing protein [Deltaproteobacteria bacterium]|nr:EAL domain-containing protein [Deltaproteobacteria bacterium]